MIGTDSGAEASEFWMKHCPGWRRAARMGGFFAAAVVVGFAATEATAATVAIVSGVALLAMSYVSAMVAAATVLLWTLSVVFEWGPAASVGGDARLVAVAFAIVLVARHRRRVLGDATATSAVVCTIALYGLPLGLLGVATADAASAVVTLTGLAFALAVSAAFAGSLRPDQIVRLFAWLNLAVVATSLVLVMFLTVGVVADRATGLFGNANALALFCALTAPFVIAVWGWTHPAVFANVILVLISGSRAGLATLLLAGGIMAVRRSGIVRYGGIGLAVAASLVFVGAIWTHGGKPADLTSGDTVFVWGEDSRSEVWDQAIEMIKLRPVTGYGLGYDAQDTASSPLRILLEGGVLGLVLALPFVVVAVRRGASEGGPFGAVLLAGLFNAVFESWFLVGGSPFFVMYVVVAVYAGRSRQVRRAPRPVLTTAGNPRFTAVVRAPRQ